MPPKPGFWYHDARRAGKTYLFLALFGLGVYLSKTDLPTTEEVWAFILRNLVRILLFLVFSSVIIFVYRRLTAVRDSGVSAPNAAGEPDRLKFSTRDEFIRALDEFRQSQGYKAGWTYYEGERRWPED